MLNQKATKEISPIKNSSLVYIITMFPTTEKDLLMDSEDFSQFKNLCFIDGAVNDTFSASFLNSETYPVVYDFTSDRESLKTSLLQRFRKIDRVSFVFHGPPDQSAFTPKRFIHNQPFFALEAGDSKDNQTFLQELFTSLHVKNVDFLACNLLQHQEWKDYFASFQNVVVAASLDATGNMKYGGNWVMENTMENVRDVYFNPEKITNFASLFATRSTVILHETNPMTGLNPSVDGLTTLTNTNVSYLQNTGFNYYNNKKELIKNTVFGSYKIVKNSANDFRTQWTVNAGRVWSDGTPITGVDLLLSHVLQSDAYSKAAGLGDPTDKKTSPAFNSILYSGVYAENIVGEPTLSADEMTVTLQFKKKNANWDLYGPVPSPVHALVLMAEGKTVLGTVAVNQAAKERFRTAFYKKDTALLKKMAKVWSEYYTITTVNTSTNPLLLVSNGRIYHRQCSCEYIGNT